MIIVLFIKSDKKIKTLTDTAELIEDAVHSATVFFTKVLITIFIAINNKIIICNIIIAFIIVFILFVNTFIFDNCEHDYFGNSDGAEFRDAELDSKMEPQQQDQEAEHKKQSTHFHRGRFLGEI